MATLLAFDTATERMSIALSAHGRVWTHDGAGGAQASAALIPAIMALLAEAGLSLSQLDAIAFGRGPGAFTGLRTACSVAQGLALGAGKPVLPVDTLLAVAESAREGDVPQTIWAASDARMNEIYAAHYAFDAGRWRTLVPPFLTTAELLNERWGVEAPGVVAGSALAMFRDELRTGAARLVPDAAPSAQAMLPLAQAMWNDGGALDAALAIPLYVRDKVAQTTAEREAARLAKEQAAEPAR
ncbi:tRNA threonylcarbamoyladenosine biosynthesis protein TsaB [Burkholderiaceae bacterium]|nr:tRNA threonylcarbamoyladenosine biosynthesis protein TsaB [Burkholderiaceae bacterium]